MRLPYRHYADFFLLVKLILYAKAYPLFYGAHFGQFGQIGNLWASRPNTTHDIK